MCRLLMPAFYVQGSDCCFQQDERCCPHTRATQGSMLKGRGAVCSCHRDAFLCSSVHAASHAKALKTSLIDLLPCLTHVIWLQVVPSQETTPQLFGPRRHRMLTFPAGQGSSLLGRDLTAAAAAAVPWEPAPAQVCDLSRRLVLSLLEQPDAQGLCWHLQQQRPEMLQSGDAVCKTGCHSLVCARGHTPGSY